MGFLLALPADEGFTRHLCQGVGLRGETHADDSHLAFPRLQARVARYHWYLWPTDGATRRVPRHHRVCQDGLVAGLFPRRHACDLRNSVLRKMAKTLWKELSGDFFLSKDFEILEKIIDLQMKLKL